KIGKSSDGVNSYVKSFIPKQISETWKDGDSAPGNNLMRLTNLSIKPVADDVQAFITVRTPVQMNFEFRCFVNNCILNINIVLTTMKGECVFNLGTHNIAAEIGVLMLNTVIPGNLLNNSTYVVSLIVLKNNSAPICEFLQCVSFDVQDVREDMYYFGTWPGIVRPQIESVLYYKAT
ncbi:MAG: hypothetical protein WKF70_05575, partial [Chitinophagaceae bacterium]